MIRCQEYARIQDFKQFTPDPLPISASHFSCPSIPQYLFIYFFDSSKSSLLYYLNFLNFCVHDIVKKIWVHLVYWICQILCQVFMIRSVSSLPFNLDSSYLVHTLIMVSMCHLTFTSLILAHCSPCQRQCELLPSLGIHRLSSVNFSHFKLLLWNSLVKLTETWSEASMEGPL
jgi:hypothetical protein